MGVRVGVANSRNKLALRARLFNDIFGLETEPISTNNLNKQKLRLKDDEQNRKITKAHTVR